MSLTIRRAQPEDLGAVAQLLTEAAAWLAELGTDQWQEPVTGRRRDRIAAGIDAGDVWVVDRAGEIVATITIDERADPEFWQPADDPGSALYAHRMVVARREAGNELGTALLDFAGQLATAAGRAWLRLDAWSSNTALQDYYRQQGFEHIRTQRYAHRGSGALFQRPASVQLGRGPRLEKGKPATGRRIQPIVRASPSRLARAQWAAGRSIWERDADGRQVTVDQVDVHEDQADDQVARLLDIAPGTRVWVRSRRYLLDGRPVQLAVSHLPADLVDGTPITRPDPGPGGIYARLADVDAEPARFVEEVRARQADAAEAAALNLGAGALVLQVVRTAIAGDGRPVETNAMVLDASAYVLRYAFSTGD